MKIWQYVAAGLVVVFGSGLCPIAHGQNVNIILDEADDPDTTSPRRQQPEPTIAIDPLNSDFLAGGAQDFRRTTELREVCGGDRWNGFQTRPMDLDIQARLGSGALDQDVFVEIDPSAPGM